MTLNKYGENTFCTLFVPKDISKLKNNEKDEK